MKPGPTVLPCFLLPVSLQAPDRTRGIVQTGRPAKAVAGTPRQGKARDHTFPGRPPAARNSAALAEAEGTGPAQKNGSPQRSPTTETTNYGISKDPLGR